MRNANGWLKILVVFAFGLAADARAGIINGDGLGQGLVYPYYSARFDNSGNEFNTYVSIVNRSADVKALRLRLREGRHSALATSLNVFLGPGDAWTAAIVPTATGARLLSFDTSCTSPPLAADASGARTVALVDSVGLDPASVREGWIQVLEMAVLTGDAAAAAERRADGSPGDCSFLQGAAIAGLIAPSGGLSGTLTLINVATGLDFTVNAEAIADLANRPYYRPASDPYPDFSAAEIEPVSVVVANGHIYRSVWSNPADAVSALFMRSSLSNEFVLDAATRSRTDFVVTYPTRHHYFAPPQPASAPFSCGGGNEAGSGEQVQLRFLDREQRTERFASGGTALFLCRAAASFDLGHAPSSATATSVLGSRNFGLDHLVLPAAFTSGWLEMTFPAARGLTSLPTSTRTRISTGEVTAGVHTYTGLPMVGFMVRTFENGTLSCAAGGCQGNYGGIFPLKFTRSIAP